MKPAKPAVIGLFLLTVCGLLIFLSGCETKDKKAKHVILISMDTTRADHFSSYGFEKKTTPHMDAFAKEGVLYQQCTSPIPQTLPAHSSMLTGTNPIYHGIHENINYTLDPVNTTLAELMKQNGFKTAAVVSSFVLDHQFGLNQGFDTYDDTFRNPIPGAHMAERRGNEVSQVGIEWIEKNKDEDFFLFLHYYDPHALYDPPEPFASQFKDDPYAGEIAYTDFCIQQVLNKLKELKLYDDSLIIITGDHAEGLGDHGEAEHGYYIYQSVMHVPLIVRYPDGRFKKKEVPNAVGIIDIVPTVCRWTGIQAPSECVGRDLTRYLEPEPDESRYIYSESLVPTNYGCSSLLSLTGDRWKYIQSSAPELYDLQNDPVELNNLIDSEAKRARVLQEELKLLLTEQVRKTESRSEEALDEKSRAKLESLGYIASSTVVEDFEFDVDKIVPADWLQTHQMILTYKSLMEAGRYDMAEKVSFKIMEDKPYYVKNYYFLADTQYKLGKYAESAVSGLEFVKRAKKKIEGDSQDKTLAPVQEYLSGCHDLIGRAYFQLKEYDKALVQFKQALETETQPDESAKINNNMGNAFLAQEKLAQALEHFQKAVELDPTLAQAYSNMGRVYVEMDSLDKALAAYEKAMRMNPEPDDQAKQKFAQSKQLLDKIRQYKIALEQAPGNAGLLDNLAASYLYLGAVSNAIECWQQSLAIKPDNPEVLNNLAFVSVDKKDSPLYDPDKAIDYAQKACELTKYQNPNFLDTLALAHAARGDFDQALGIAQQALNLAQSQNDPVLVQSIQKNIEHYKNRSRP